MAERMAAHKLVQVYAHNLVHSKARLTDDLDCKIEVRIVKQ